MALIPPFFLDCVVAIGTRPRRRAKAEWSASGFLYGHFISAEGDQKTYSIYLVTNRHVFARAKTVVLRFNPKGSEPAREFDERLRQPSGEPKWLAHPDPKIDIAVLPIIPAALDANGIQYNWFRSDQHVLTRSSPKEPPLAEGDGAFVLGFPMGIVGGDRNYVILRQGSIARIQDWLAGASSEFLVDATVFPGNSGGPVVSIPQRVAITGTAPQQSANLIGLVKAYVPYVDVAISSQTERARITFEENSGLTAVVPIDFVDEVIRAHVQTRPSPPPTEIPILPPEAPSEPSPSETVAPSARALRRRVKAKSPTTRRRSPVRARRT